MQFDDNGYLVPYGAIESNLNEILQEFCFTEQRAVLYQKFVDFMAELQKLLGVGFEVWVNGSFTSKKNVPNDIDLLVFLDYKVLKLHDKALEKYVSLEYHKTMKLDCYFLGVYPLEHKLYSRYLLDRKEWLFNWTQKKDFRTKQFNSKGFLTLTF
jgi:hypothetical protein